MKSILLATALAFGTTGYALAADMAEEVVIVDQAYDWSGVYVGVFGGWAHNRTEATDVTGEEFGAPTPGATESLSDDGFVGGITAGYNFQSGSWVYGPEIELGWVSNEELYINPNDDDNGVYTKYGFYGAVTGRLGYAANRTLFYAKGGVAFAKIDSAGGEYDGPEDDENGFDDDEAGVGDDTRIGWTIGGGVEHALTDRWSIKAEYLYADFGSESYDTTDTNEPFDFDDQLHTVKIGLNYQF